MKNLTEMKVKELRVMARELGIKKYQSAGKGYLIPEIEKVIKAQEAEKKAQEETKAKAEKANKKAKTYNGKTLTEWSDELDMPVATLRARLNRGWSYEETFCKDNHKAKQGGAILYNGKAQSLNAWARELGISVHTLNARINRLGWEVEKAFETAPKTKQA